MIRKEDEEFPEFLASMDDGPEQLYCIGDISLLKKPSVAVVGARKCSEYGRQTAVAIGEALAHNGVVLVSGMAMGIDGIAHRAALKERGKTIAVLAGGADICYPKANRSLYKEICEKGLVISEYPPGTEPKKWQFVARNRIISAISQVTVVVEAGSSSGALITAVKGAEQGKTVMAVPGNINSIYSVGTNRIIKDGAEVLTTPDDIFLAMGIESSAPQGVYEKMGADEAAIYKIVQYKGETTVDFISGELRKSAAEISGLVAVMEMKGILSYSLGKIFIAKF